ncbi:MAG: hypothetical protein ACK4YP_17080 [Myxococcota bacterium]
MFAFLLFAACTPPGDDAGSDTADTGEDPLRGTAALATVSGGACPDVTGGDVTITSNGLERTVKVLLPDSGGEGKGVVFAWYPLGGSAQWLINALDLRAWADDNDLVVVVPTASGEDAFEWAFLQSPEANDDLVLFDDLRTCLSEQLTVDLGRVYSAGFSAGALWTSFLAIHRGDTLAAILPFSGGADPVIAYQTPAGKFPALLPHGGETDLYGGGAVDFEDTQTAFATGLHEDGHFVVMCDHGGGHTIPREGVDMLTAWLPAHTFGAPSPFVGDLSAFPDYCSVFEP